MLTFPREVMSVADLMDMKNIYRKALSELPKTDKVILVTGDSWAAGEWDKTKDGTPEGFVWRSEHSIGHYLEEITGYNVISQPNPGWDDIESVCTLTILESLVDYIVFFKTCGLRGIQHENHSGRDSKPGFTFDNFKELDGSLIKNVVKQCLIINHTIYGLLEKFESKLILLGGLNKITKKGLKLKTVYTLPSILEFFDHTVQDSELFGWEDMWTFYKDEVKGNKEYRDSLLYMMDVFANKKKYLRSRPDLYWPDGKHPNAESHRKLAEHISTKLK